MNRLSYEKLIDEDIEWLKKSPNTLERQHIEQVLRCSPDNEYGNASADMKFASLQEERDLLMGLVLSLQSRLWDWKESVTGAKDVIDVVRMQVAQIALTSGRFKPFADELPRTPEGHINNCALACGEEMSSCQMCKNDCPDKDRVFPVRLPKPAHAVLENVIGYCLRCGGVGCAPSDFQGVIACSRCDGTGREPAL